MVVLDIFELTRTKGTERSSSVALRGFLRIRCRKQMNTRQLPRV